MGSSPGVKETPLSTKLGVRPGTRLALLHAPEGIEGALDPLPPGVTLQHGLRRNQRVSLILAFVTERDHLARNIGWLIQTLPPDGGLWVAWPKRASKLVTDMTDHAVRDVALPIGWVDVKVCAIDSDWSALKLILRKDLRSKGLDP